MNNLNIKDVYYADPNHKDTRDPADPSFICIARQVVLKLNTQNEVLVTHTTSSKRFKIKLRHLRSGRQHELAARGMVKVPPDQQFFIMVNNLPSIEVHLQKHMNMAHTDNSPNIVLAIKGVNTKHLSSIGIPEDNKKSYPIHLMYQTSEVSAVLYETTGIRGMHLQRQNVVQDGNKREKSKIIETKVRISGRHFTFHGDLIEMITEF